MNPKLSVIVPIWGVEKFIEKCARSLFESDFEDMEFIFVDDCTPDKSIEILQKVMIDYPSRKEQTQIIHHKENKGLPQARKTGYLASRGEWITYVDSDDWIASSMYSKMMCKACAENCDFVCCDFVYQSDDKILWEPTYDENQSPEQLRYNLLALKVSNAVWNKIVHRSVYMKDEIYFPIFSMDEDDVLTCQLAYYSNKPGYVHECLYFHYANPDSMTHQKTRDKIIKSYKEQFENRLWMVNFFESKNDKRLNYAITKNKAYIKVLYAKINNQTPRNFYPEVNSYMIFSKDYSFPLKVRNTIVLLFYPLFPFLQKLYLHFFKKE